MGLGLVDIQRSMLPGYHRAQIMALDEERRRGRRYEAVVTTAILGWWAGGESRIRPARLVNISRGGALLLAAEAPREMERANFALSPDRECRWVPGIALGSAVDATGQYLLHFKFDAPCPDAVFGMALGLVATVRPIFSDNVLDSDEVLAVAFSGTEEFEGDLIELVIESPYPETAEFACFDASAHKKLAKSVESSAARIR